MSTAGRVTLVGAGPGDPELITLRGVRALQRADVVLYDRLVAREILEHARPDAELVYVGKRCGGQSVPQEEINRLLVEHARSGRAVVRLKNGDPFVFGRGGEELEALEAAGIPFEVVPGITAALAAGAYCGVPLTLRGQSSSVTLITAHEDPRKGHSDVDWAALARSGSTLVLYMAMAHLEDVVSKLMASGVPEDMPAAIITRATLPEQVSLRAPLNQLPGLVRKHNLVPPSVMIIGAVAGFDARAAWFEALPLFGRTIVVTADRIPLIRDLRTLGARVWELCKPAPGTAAAGPGGCLQTELPGQGTRGAIEELQQARADLVVFTSPGSTLSLAEQIPGKDLPSATRVPAIAPEGEAARAAREMGFSIVAECSGESPEALLQAIQEYCGKLSASPRFLPSGDPYRCPRCPSSP